MYNTMIRALATSVHPYTALLLFKEMRRMGVLPGKHTFPFILKACLVHSHVLKFGLDLDLHVYNGLVRGYGVTGSMGDARQVFDEMPGRNGSIWTSMICGYAQNDYSNEALLLFNQMVADGFEPNGATLASVLSACAQQECLVLGERIEQFMREREQLNLGRFLAQRLLTCMQ
ncbi:hypothetical protein Cgig2_022704 [Carnegiea gigantea]|uniref:Pentatricopeptide repeat-containing protein n=1 Tax=Carnegiea gigantea TaxID=171969 RepID=A0A9Q1K6H1_9CARY|nr:hypothetical protein Cgig2_022704 [Carnegiea gigantea]